MTNDGLFGEDLQKPVEVGRQVLSIAIDLADLRLEVEGEMRVEGKRCSPWLRFDRLNIATESDLEQLSLLQDDLLWSFEISGVVLLLKIILDQFSTLTGTADQTDAPRILIVPTKKEKDRALIEAFFE